MVATGTFGGPLKEQAEFIAEMYKVCVPAVALFTEYLQTGVAAVVVVANQLCKKEEVRLYQRYVKVSAPRLTARERMTPCG